MSSRSKKGKPERYPVRQQPRGRQVPEWVWKLAVLLGQWLIAAAK